MIRQTTLSFLSDLSRNNNKAWFENHRGDFEAAKDDFASFAGKVLESMQKQDEDLAPLIIKDCLFRINRDVRFSKDKSPYKSHFAALMSKGGKKSNFAGYYLHIEPGKSFVGGGVWMPMPAETKKVRQEIDYSFPEFSKMIGSSAFKKAYGDLERSPESLLSKVPKGYEKENPAAEYLKLKSWVATHNIADEDVTSKDLTKAVIGAYKALLPLIKFLNRSLDE